ncbi:cobyrinate a,c-diamide synthase [Parasulfuritortus cantonensis]|uniref:Cobyrinate a,c-diamide synthase n=1 Tax=Parasulfuritortus cantonensis TaxID=2528202 RepID=A0A4R1BHA6_9PROT|nr:cobyrinate a,c-diamide synthase [Parasulfuritortus cantonensis]TCJ16603.1 cobyrinate a,c-diamide synthase [Parasulfuritortus cantonensis]
MPSLYISAAHKSSGKTTVTLGLCRALRERGLAVQAYKKGPDYIDPIWHRLAAGRPSYNLDFRLMERSEIDGLYARHAAGADICLVEGNKGLYDGMDLEGSDSNAALAKQLGLPVVLVIDTIGITRGVAPLLLGYRAFDPAVNIAGLVLNKVGGPRHEDKLRRVIEHYVGLPVLGAIHKDARLAIEERHLGLVPGNESDEAEQRIAGIAEAVAGQVDLDALLRLATTAPAPAAGVTFPAAPATRVKVAIARDRAFGFYYQEDLDTLEAAGVELVPVDCLADAALPAADGLIIGGGFPESFIDRLAANLPLRQAILRAAEAGLPVYAECGGLMYLSRSITWRAHTGEMVGLVPGDAVMGDHPVGRGYASLAPTASAPLDAPGGPAIPAHEFHHSRLENLPDGLSYAYQVKRGHGIDGRNDGYVHKNLLAAYCHRRGTGPRGWIAPFLAKVRSHAEQRNAARKAA